MTKSFWHFGWFDAFLILYFTHETYGQRPCIELLKRHLIPRADVVYLQDFAEQNLQKVSISQILGKAVNTGSTNCLLMDYNPDKCSPTVTYDGFVLMTDTDIRLVNIHTYSKDYKQHWLTQVYVQRIDYIFHVYKMTFIAVHKEMGSKYMEVKNISEEIKARFETYFAALVISDTRDSVAFATCGVRSSSTSDHKFFLSGGWVTRYAEGYNATNFRALLSAIAQNTRLKLSFPS